MEWSHFSVEGSDGGTVACSSLDGGGTRSLIVLGHGIGSSRFNSTNTVLGPRLAEEGFDVVLYDAYGHGESSGEFGRISQLDIARNIVDVAAACASGRAIGLLGNSYSGGASLVAAGKTDVACMGLKAPCLDWESALIQKVGQDAVSAWELVGIAPGLDDRPMHFETVRAMRTADLFAALRDLTVPVCVWQGTADDIIPRSDWERVRDICAATGNQFVEVEGADHVLSEPFFEPFIDDVVEFFANNLK